jgi:hypothetical protein
MSLEERLARIETLLAALMERQAAEWYSIEQFSRLVGRSVLTCREWCRLGRIHARKKESGRGAYREWVISHEELERFRRDGLLPPSKPIAH